MPGSKPDYIDIDGDGNKNEPMKSAAKEEKSEAQRFKDIKTDEVKRKMRK